MINSIWYARYFGNTAVLTDIGERLYRTIEIVLNVANNIDIDIVKMSVKAISTILGGLFNLYDLIEVIFEPDVAINNEFNQYRHSLNDEYAM